jgi:hypothetical protein
MPFRSLARYVVLGTIAGRVEHATDVQYLIVYPMMTVIHYSTQMTIVPIGLKTGMIILAE